MKQHLHQVLKGLPPSDVTHLKIAAVIAGLLLVITVVVKVKRALSSAAASAAEVAPTGGGGVIAALIVAVAGLAAVVLDKHHAAVAHALPARPVPVPTRTVRVPVPVARAVGQVVAHHVLTGTEVVIICGFSALALIAVFSIVRSHSGGG